MTPTLPQVKDLVLVGGGHAHVHVLKAFAMRPVAGLRITLISREVDTPYSGMLPGLVTDTYSVADVHIDLLRLARYCGARLLVGEVCSIDPEQHELHYQGAPGSAIETVRALRYDLLSINTGAAPNCPFNLPHVVPVKPIGQFLPGWQRLAERIGSGQRLAIVGGGAGGVEIALAAQRTLGAGVEVALLTSSQLLPDVNARTRLLAREALRNAGVELREQFRVTDIDTAQICASTGEQLSAQAVLWVTGVAAPAWLAQSGLALDDTGFIEVDAWQRSVSAPNVYAGGDVAGMRDQPRPKSGVFAVRQGPILARNLRAAALGKPSAAKRYRAQPRFLALLNCADGTAIASYGPLAFRSRWLWRLKDHIDRAFMRKFNALPPMQHGAADNRRTDVLESPELGAEMRCGGCGSKLNATLLARVLRDLDVVDAPWVQQGIGDDAAVLTPSAAPLVLTTDGFRSMLDDTELFGRVLAHHALSDVYAMGATPTSVLLNAVVPLMSEAMMEQELRDLLRGVLHVLREANVPLVGGHSAEGLELQVSLAVTGQLEGEQSALTKTAGSVGDAIVLTKGLGTGALLAAAMRGEIDASDWHACLRALDCSNRNAARILRAHQATACTDVTGFGLVGHLAEMLGADSEGEPSLGARIRLQNVPLLPGAVAAVEAGIVSTLQVANERAFDHYELSGDVARTVPFRLLADPQTAGGLLATLPAERAEDCVVELQRAGYPQAAVIGELHAGSSRIQ